MAVSKQMEVVSIQALNRDTHRVGLSAIGRIDQYSQRAADPAGLGPVSADAVIDWPAADPLTIGQVISVEYQRAPGA